MKDQWNECQMRMNRSLSTTFSLNECQMNGNDSQVQAVEVISISSDQEKSLLDASSGFPQYYCSDEWTLPHFDTRHRFEFDENMNVCVPASTSMSLENLVQDAVKLIHPYDEFSVSLFNEWFPSIFQLEEDYLTYFEYKYHDDLDRIVEGGDVKTRSKVDTCSSSVYEKVSSCKRKANFWCCECVGWIGGSKSIVAGHLRKRHHDVECKIIHVTRSGLKKITKTKFLTTYSRPVSSKGRQAASKNVLHYKCTTCEIWIDGGDVMVCDHLKTTHPCSECDILCVFKSSSLIMSKSKFLAKNLK